MNIPNRTWQQKAGARLMPLFEGAVVITTLLAALAIIFVAGIYILAAIGAAWLVSLAFRRPMKKLFAGLTK